MTLASPLKGLTLLVALGSAGCLGAAPAGDAPGARVAIAVSPLRLAGVADARYSLTVTNAANGAGDLVWQRTALTSTQYGDGTGSLTYVGPCDASTGTNSIRLDLEALFEAGAALIPSDRYHNPTPITLDVPCLQDRDTAVRFDITVARSAEQGFFDISVNFDDIFCSAKLDCVRAGTTDDLELLHNPLAGGQRDLTAVLGLACTASPGAASTSLYLDDPVITCVQGATTATTTFSVLDVGNVDLAGPGASNPGGYLFAAAVHRGNEGLASKAFWNVSFGLNSAAFAAAGVCTLRTRATASATPFPQTLDGYPLPPGAVYPVIDWEVALSNAAGRTCTTHEVNVSGSGVATHYLGYLPAFNQFSWSPGPITLDNRYDTATGWVGGPTAPSCSDGVGNGGESDVDCGGPCAACAAGDACAGAGDCASGVCAGSTCQAPTCADGVENGDETGTDCGGGCPGACAAGAGCLAAADCDSGVCETTVCQAPSCGDGVANGDESDVDCGGSCATACAAGAGCVVAGDCDSGVCASTVCQAPSCGDGVANGDESDVDCGGAACDPCADGEGCVDGGDCASGGCTAGACDATATCDDGVQNGDEAGVDCGGASCAACVPLVCPRATFATPGVDQALALTAAHVGCVLTITVDGAGGGKNQGVGGAGGRIVFTYQVAQAGTLYALVGQGGTSGGPTIGGGGAGYSNQTYAGGGASALRFGATVLAIAGGGGGGYYGATTGIGGAGGGTGAGEAGRDNAGYTAATGGSGGIGGGTTYSSGGGRGGDAGQPGVHGATVPGGYSGSSTPGAGYAAYLVGGGGADSCGGGTGGGGGGYGGGGSGCSTSGGGGGGMLLAGPGIALVSQARGGASNGGTASAGGNGRVVISAPCAAGTWDNGTDCVSCTAIANCAAVTCTSASNSTCAACAGGYAGPGCANIDECALDGSLCGEDLGWGTCIDSAGSFLCSCGSGYFGDGTTSCAPCADPEDPLCTAASIHDFGTYRAWSDGSLAATCDDYRHPLDPADYQGATGDGVYRLDADGVGGAGPFDAWCDMNTAGGGWTRIVRTTGQSEDFGQMTASVVTSFAGTGATAGVYEAFRSLERFDRVMLRQVSGGTQTGAFVAFNLVEAISGRSVYDILLEDCRTASCMSNNDSAHDGARVQRPVATNALGAWTSEYSGLRYDGTLRVNGSDTTSHFFLCGVNESSDNDHSVLAFSNATGSVNGWGDSWRGASQAGTIWSFWNGDYHSCPSTAHIGNSYGQANAGYKGSNAGTYEVYLR